MVLIDIPQSSRRGVGSQTCKLFFLAASQNHFRFQKSMGKAHTSLISKPKKDKINGTSSILVSLLNICTKISSASWMLANNKRKIHFSKTKPAPCGEEDSEPLWSSSWHFSHVLCMASLRLFPFTSPFTILEKLLSRQCTY